MDALLTIYWLCFGVGLVYVLLSGTLGAVSHGLHALGGADHGGDAGHVGLDHGAEAGGHAEAHAEGHMGELHDADLSDSDQGAAGHASEHAAGHGHPAMHVEAPEDSGFAHYSPFSPLNVMGFFCAFGAAGLLSSAYHATPYMSLIYAAGGGLGMALILWLLIGKLLYSLQGSSEGHAIDMLGLEAEVLTPVEREMSGEIAYILDGTRYTSPARLLNEGRIEKHETVRIRRVEGNVVYVEPRRKLLE